ncbi:MAG TPA: hypothetical protein ENL41_03540, partial [candidate division WOR-3 bacterium]|nr:hypothetical protein [candidate division WOR-3 bacterium]
LHFLIAFKFISLVPSITEIFYLLDADDSLLATTIYCDYPKEALEKPKVGDLIHPDYEKILRLSPDYILITLPMQEMVRRNLDKLGLKWLAFSPESIEGVLKTIDSLGKITGKITRSAFVIDSLRKILKTLESPLRSPGVYIELSYKPLYTCGRKSFINEVIEAAGGRNIFADQNTAYFSPPQEDIIKKSPDIIILAYPGAQKEKIYKRLGWENVRAVKKHHIYILDQDIISRPGPRIFSAIKILNKMFIEWSKAHNP